MMFPPELMRLILSMPEPPPEMLREYREPESLHELAHVVIDLAELDEPCDTVVKRLREYNDLHFTLLLFHLGLIHHTFGFDDDEDDESDEAPPLLN